MGKGRSIGAWGLIALAGCYSGVEFDAGDLVDTEGDPPGVETGDETGEETGDETGGDRDTAGDPPAAGCGPDIAADQLLRLTRRQYENAVRDVFAVDVSVADAFPEDGRVGPFAVNGVEPPSQLQLESYLDAAEEVAELVGPTVGVMSACDPAADDELDCARDFVHDQGRRLFRRPLQPDEVERYASLYMLETDAAHEDRLAVVVEALLQSPNFLYRIELGEPDPEDPQALRLTGYEVATRLSFFLWNSIPDAELLDAAEAGMLETPEGVEEQARRMLAQVDRASETLGEFHTRWLGIEGVSNIHRTQEAHPDFSATLAEDLETEARLLTADIVLEGKGTVASLLGASHSFVSPALAPLYGLDGGHEGFVRTELDPEHRAGILTLPAVMAATSHETQTSPVLRGKLLRERLLCQVVPPPPPTVDDTPPHVDPGASAREQFEQHTVDPGCFACHHLMDPMGFGFERYDEIGALREVEDSWGEVTSSVDADGRFDTARELAELLQGSHTVRSCIAQQWFWYAMNRGHGDADESTLESLVDLLDDSEGELRELIVAIATTPQFGTRCVPEED